MQKIYMAILSSEQKCKETSGLHLCGTNSDMLPNSSEQMRERGCHGYLSQTDRLSNLPNELLVSILSLLPIRTAARTSVLCRQFRHLWKASLSLDLISPEFPFRQSDKFFVLANHLILDRNPSQPLHNLHINITSKYGLPETICSFITSLIAKISSHNLRHLIVVEDNLSLDFSPILPIIFSIDSLESLSLPIITSRGRQFEDHVFGSSITLTRLRSLTLGFIQIDPVKVTQFLSKLCSLEELNLEISGLPRFSLSSQTIRKLKLVFVSTSLKLNAELFLPSLESLHLETRGCLENQSNIHGELPLLRKAVIVLPEFHDKHGTFVAELLNCISQVQDLSLYIKQTNENDKHPVSILSEPSEHVPKFRNLKHFDVTLCFHEHNYDAIVTLLRRSPALEAVNMVHEDDIIFRTKKRSRKAWRSWLPRNADGNYNYAHFTNLHFDRRSKEFMELVSKKCNPKYYPAKVK